MVVNLGRLPPRSPWVYALTALVITTFLISLHRYHSALYISTPSSLAPGLFESIGNNTLGFQKILVVGLPERTDRRDGMILAARLSGIDLEFVDSVHGETVADKALPGVRPSELREELNNAAIGCWRGHVNALKTIVHQNLGSALIVEDDIDWDIRIKEQLQDFALATNALTQPLYNDPTKYADFTYPHPPDSMSVPASMEYSRLPYTVPPKNSPYGDEWEMLWLGHCGMRVPSPERDSPETLAKGIIVRPNDPTVPKHEFVTNHRTNDLRDLYPPHTRLYQHGTHGLCALAYAVSQTGAQRMLHELGLEKIQAYDVGLLNFCDRATACLTTQPPLFEHFRPKGWAGAESDIDGHGDAMKDKAESLQIRYSVRINEEVILRGGRESEYIDQYPD